MTVILPALAPAGTPAVIVPELGCVNGAATPLNRTEVVELKPLPETVTVVATGPDVGVKEEIRGDGGAAPAEESPRTVSERTPTSAMPARRARARPSVEERTRTNLLERRERVRILVDPEVHRCCLEVGERMRGDHRIHSCASFSRLRLGSDTSAPMRFRSGR